MNEDENRSEPRPKPAAVILIGPPGAGKGTQGRILGMIPGFYHWEAGRVLRDIDPNSEVGRKTKDVLARGDLLPDELVVEVFRESVFGEGARQRCGNDLLVLDGIPRTTGQARSLQPMVDVFLVLHFTTPDPERLFARLARRAHIEGRADDVSVDIVRHRFEVYRRQTEPVLREFPSDIVVTIDAIRDAAEVTHDVLGRILRRRPAGVAG